MEIQMNILFLKNLQLAWTQICINNINQVSDSGAGEPLILIRNPSEL